MQSLMTMLQRVLPWRRARLSELHGIVKSTPYPSFAERSEIGFEEMVEVYKKDEDARIAADFLANSITGPGHYTVANIPEAKELVDEFAEQVNLDGLLQKVAVELAAFGNSFTELVTPDQLEDLKPLPISSKWEVNRDEFGNIRGYAQVVGSRRVEFKPSELIHWAWNRVDAEPFGRGLIQTLLEERSYTLRFTDGSTQRKRVPCLYDLKSMMRDDLRKLLHHNVPRSAWVFGDKDNPASDEFVRAQAAIIRSLDAGERITTNKPVQIVEEVLDPRGKYDFLINFLQDAYIRALQTPIPRLYTSRGFTEASARVIQDFFKWQTEPLQRFMARVVEQRIYRPLLEQHGFDPREANVRLRWGLPERPGIRIEELLRAVELGVIRVEEFRKMASKLAGWELWEQQR